MHRHTNGSEGGPTIKIREIFTSLHDPASGKGVVVMSLNFLFLVRFVYRGYLQAISVFSISSESFLVRLL